MRPGYIPSAQDTDFEPKADENRDTLPDPPKISAELMTFIVLRWVKFAMLDSTRLCV